MELHPSVLTTLSKVEGERAEKSPRNFETSRETWVAYSSKYRMSIIVICIFDFFKPN